VHVVAAHEKILDACRARKPEVAASRMAAHIGELEHLVKHRFRSVLDEPTRMLIKT
jgi:DNA-binding GntR family transcriptional regulator